VSLGSNVTIKNSSFNQMVDEGIHHGFFPTGIGIFGAINSRITHIGLGTDPTIYTFNNCQRAGIYTNASYLNTSSSVYSNIGRGGINCSNQSLSGATIDNNRFISNSNIAWFTIYLEKGATSSLITNNYFTANNAWNLGNIYVTNPQEYSSMVTIFKNTMVNDYNH